MYLIDSVKSTGAGKRQAARENTQEAMAEAELRKEEEEMLAAMRMIRSQENEEESLQLKMQIIAKSSSTTSSSQVSTAATSTTPATLITTITTTINDESSINNTNTDAKEDAALSHCPEDLPTHGVSSTPSEDPAISTSTTDATPQPKIPGESQTNPALDNGPTVTDVSTESSVTNASVDASHDEDKGSMEKEESNVSTSEEVVQVDGNERVLIKPALRSGRRRKVLLDEHGYAIQTKPPRPPPKKPEPKAWAVVNGTAVKLSLPQASNRVQTTESSSVSGEVVVVSKLDGESSGSGGSNNNNNNNNSNNNNQSETPTSSSTTNASSSDPSNTQPTDLSSLIDVVNRGDAMHEISVKTAQGEVQTITAPELRQTLAGSGSSKDDQIKAIEELLFQKRSEAILATIRGHIPPYVPQVPPPPIGPDGKPMKRKPGRPPGYFLGPTSCLYCRQQHRRCDNQKVCSRCAKAGIPCDRTGTVERPSVRSKELKLAKAIIECVEKGTPVPKKLQIPAETQESSLLSMVYAAKSKMTPEQAKKIRQILDSMPFVRRAGQQQQQPAQASSSSSSSHRLSGTAQENGNTVASGSSSSVTNDEGSQDGRKRRRRSPSPSQISRANIMEPNTKRLATRVPPQRFDPTEYDTKRKRSKTAASSDLETEKGSKTATGKPRGRPPQSSSSSSSSGTSVKESTLDAKTTPRRVGRPPGRPSLSGTVTAVKKRPGRPPKVAKRVGRPPKKLEQDSSSTRSSSTSSSTALVPRKRGLGAVAETDGRRKRVEVSQDSSGHRSTDARHQTAIKLVRKTFLKSGLYSADLKMNSPLRRLTGTSPSSTPAPTSPSSSSSTSSSKQLVTRRNDVKGKKRPFFELPINYGETLMNTQRDFVLPFDIMQAWKLGALIQRKQPDPFIKIRSNVFVERKRRVETSPMVCHCKRPPPEAGVVGCGEDCYNRVMFYECVSAHCPCGDQCSNQRFQRKNPNEDHLEVIWTEERGFGIRTTKPIRRGSLVIEYRGEVISQKLCLERMEGMYKNNKNFYFLEYEKGEVVDACLKGTNARFVNHSCSPNSQIEKWFLNGEMSIGIFASQDIPAMTEITYDYNFSSFSGAHLQECRCGSANCRGYIGSRSQGARLKEMSNDGLDGAGSPSSSGSVNGNGGTGRKGSHSNNGPGRKKGSGRKKSHHTTSRRRDADDHHTLSVRYAHLPTLKTLRQRQSDKYKESKIMAIRYTRLFLFRNIREVECKYIKYAQTKSRGYQHNDNESRRARLAQARQGRKRSLEGVVESLRKAALEEEEREQARRAAEDEARKREAQEEEAAEHAAAQVAAAKIAAAVGSAGETDSFTTGSVEPSEAGFEAAEEEEEDDDEEEVDELDGEDEEAVAPSSSSPSSSSTLFAVRTPLSVEEPDEFENGEAPTVSQLKQYLNRKLGISSESDTDEQSVSPERHGAKKNRKGTTRSAKRGLNESLTRTRSTKAKDEIVPAKIILDDEEEEETEKDVVVVENEDEEEVDELADDVDGDESLKPLREAMLKKAQATHSNIDNE
ncbi:Histone-Lysine N-Methyltransferase ash1l [Actinomortierella wolfii]|nr:Histone-Lysine N-Methyltransferase ash1l [Actinomortierella wolfii]